MQDIAKFTIKTSTLKRKSSNPSLPDQNSKKISHMEQNMPTGSEKAPLLSSATPMEMNGRKTTEIHEANLPLETPWKQMAKKPYTSQKLINLAV